MESWYHPSCFFKVNKAKIETSSAFKGFDTLRIDDQRMIKETIGESVEDDPVVGNEETAALNDKFWELKEKIEDLPQKDLKYLLQLNNIPQTGGKSLMVNRVADGMFYGVSICPMCSGREMWFTEGKYKCQAQLEWGSCGYEGNIGVKIEPWVSPKHSEHDFIAKWVFAANARPAVKARKPVVAFYERDAKSPFKGMTFTSYGRTQQRSEEELKTFIKNNGGKYVSELNPDVDYMISTYSDLLQNKEPIQKALSMQIAIVPELLVDRLYDEFGFDQQPYLLAGKLPPIGLAKLKQADQPAADKAAASSTPRKTTKEEMSSMTKRKGRLYPEAKCPNGKVHQENGVNFEVMLTQTDIVSGMNKYYHLQLIDMDSNGQKFLVFSKFGRVGTDVGAFYKSNPSGLKGALEIFHEKYFDKSGNKWEERENFVKKPNKYYPIKVDLEEEAEEKKEDEGDFSITGLSSSMLPSYLDPRVQDIVNLMFDVTMIKRQMQDMSIDVKKMPLGKLTRSHIQRGYEVLRKIEEVLKKDEDTKEFQLLNLSSQFYTLIPHIFPQDKKPPIIDSYNALKAKMNQIESLLDIQIASTLMSEEAPQYTSMNPIDANYKKLGIELKPVNRLGREWKLLNKYVETGVPENADFGVQVLDAFQVNRAVENEKFKPFKDTRPRKLLWHGSRLCNYVSILNQGLRIAPPEAPTSGYMFGKGLYFADVFAKSAGYCYTNPENNLGVLLLCDVALGDSYQVKKPEYVEKLPDGKLSTLALSKFVPDPTKEETVEDKIVIPIGKLSESGLADVFLEHSEYVVYNVSQVRIRYMLKVKFDFKKTEVEKN
jgi:poly [ADP-ribose] polymerase